MKYTKKRKLEVHKIFLKRIGIKEIKEKAYNEGYEVGISKGKEIRKELGLGLQNGANQGNKGGFGKGMNRNRVNQ